MKQCRDAVLQYAMLSQCLWSADYAPIVIFKVFDDTDWAEGISGDKNRVALIKRAFDETSGMPWTYFPTSLFLLRSRHPVSGVVWERVGTLC